MRDLVTFYLSVKYRAPSKERLFLDMNWGVRDVSGPYLNSPEGFLYIDRALLSSDISSTISFVLSISNRCPTASVLARVSTQEGKFSQYIERNGSKEFTIGSVYSGSKPDYMISVCLPEVSVLPDSASFSDILAIDEITIERYR